VFGGGQVIFLSSDWPRSTYHRQSLNLTECSNFTSDCQVEMAATTAALDTYELLENIISQLPRSDIETVQRVSKQWRQLIGGSFVIRRARCLSVVETSNPEESFWSHADNDEHTQKLVNYFVDYPQKPPHQGNITCFQALMHVPAKMCPIIHGKRRASDFYLPGVSFAYDVTSLPSKSFSNIRKEMSKIGAKSPCKSREEFYQQYISEPPVSIIYLQVSELLRSGRSKPLAQCSLRVSTGVTIKDLVEGIQRSINTPPFSHKVKVELLSWLATKRCEQNDAWNY